jgi:putative flippase GtrA
MKKDIITVVGFALFLLGFIALFLSLVGLNLTMFSFLEDLPAPYPFLSKIIMIVLGTVIIYVAKFDPSKETRS